jgi:hypothetical protein
MSPSFKCPIAVCILLVLSITALINAATQGFLEGHLKVVSLRLADENRTTAKAANYADYPLIILSQGEKKQIARITADKDGNYRAALPPGGYILDVEGRVPKRLRVRAQPFTVVSNETVHIDMTIVTGFAAEGSTSQE